jgi:hypothetical protein
MNSAYNLNIDSVSAASIIYDKGILIGSTNGIIYIVFVKGLKKVIIKSTYTKVDGLRIIKSFYTTGYLFNAVFGGNELFIGSKLSGSSN